MGPCEAQARGQKFPGFQDEAVADPHAPGSGRGEPEGFAALVIDAVEIFARAGGVGRVAPGQGPVSPIRSHIRDGHGVAGGLGHPVLSKRNLGWGSSASRCQKNHASGFGKPRGSLPVFMDWRSGPVGDNALFSQHLQSRNLGDIQFPSDSWLLAPGCCGYQKCAEVNRICLAKEGHEKDGANGSALCFPEESMGRKMLVFH